MLQTYDPRNASLMVNINGTLVPREEAGISPFDSSVQNGDGVWEGLRLYDGGIFRLTAHLDRLRRSAVALAYADIPAHDVIVRELRRTLEANAMRDGVHVRLTLTRGVKYTSGLDPRINNAGSTLIVLAEHKPPVYDPSGVSLITANHRRPLADVLDQNIHSCNQLTSILAKLEANAAGADDALMLDTRGYVAETNATHLFFVRDGIVKTPTTAACPEGITRQAILDLCLAHAISLLEGDYELDEVHAADEIFCTGTMGEIVSVTRVDDRTFPSAGPVTARLTAHFADLVQREREMIID